MEAEHKTEAGSGSVDRDLPRQHDWLTPMANVQSELQACQECWEEAVKKIKKPKSGTLLEHYYIPISQNVIGIRLFSLSVSSSTACLLSGAVVNRSSPHD